MAIGAVADNDKQHLSIDDIPDARHTQGEDVEEANIESHQSSRAEEARSSIAIPVSKHSTSFSEAQRPMTSPARMSQSSESFSSTHSSSRSATRSTARRPGSRLTMDHGNTSSSSIHESGIDLGVGQPSVGQVQLQEPSMDIAQMKAASILQETHESLPQVQQTIHETVDAPAVPSSVKKTAPTRRDRLSMGMSLPFLRNRVVSDQDVLYDVPKPATLAPYSSPVETPVEVEPLASVEKADDVDHGVSDASRTIAGLSIQSAETEGSVEILDDSISLGIQTDGTPNVAKESIDILGDSISYDQRASPVRPNEAMSPIDTRAPNAYPGNNVPDMSLLELSSFVEGLGQSPEQDLVADHSDGPAESPRRDSNQPDRLDCASIVTSKASSLPSPRFPNAAPRQQAFYSSSASYKRPVSSHASPVISSTEQERKAREALMRSSTEPLPVPRHAQEPSRPSTSGSVDVTENKTSHDISFSFEPSFIGSEAELHTHTTEATLKQRHLQTVPEMDLTPVQQRIAALQARGLHSSSPSAGKHGADLRMQMHKRSLSGLGDLSDENSPVPKGKANAVAAKPSRQTDSYSSPLPNATHGSKTQAQNWETPAAAKKYSNEAPTDTAIARRVEKFQIPAEQLQALQPSIEALRADTLIDRQAADRLTVKESSARIDSLQKENFGLKLKVMFLERHFSGEVDQDKAALRNETVRLGTIATDLVNKNRSLEKSLKSALDQVAALELEKAKSSSKTSKADDAIQRSMKQQLIDAEAHIDRLEAEEDAEILDLKDELAEAKEQIEVLHKELDAARAHRKTEEGSQSFRARNDPEGDVLRDRCLDLEDELDDLDRRCQRQIAFLEQEIADKNDLLAECREKLDIAVEDLQQYDIQLEDVHRQRSLAVADVVAEYEVAHHEYENYIQDRHAEIDDLKRQLRSHDQDSFDARLADAVKPHEDAWRELSAQCSALEMALRDKQRIYDEDRQRLESELADTLDRERRLCEECDDLSEQLAHKDEAIEELRARCEEAEHQLDHIHTSGGTGSATKTEELVKLRQTVAALEAERQETRLARHTLENKLQETGDKNGALEVELENRREVLDQLRQDLEDAQRKTPALAKQLADYQERFTALDLKCQAYEADLAEAHAAMDDANREAEHLRRKLAQNLQADATAEVTSQTLVQELGAANAQWQEAQKEARHARSELGRIRAAVQELDGFLADRSLPEAVAAVLTHQASEADRLTQQIARIRETQEQDAYAHAAQARSIEVLDKKRAALEKQAEANKAVAEKAEQVLSQRERELDNSNKALKAQLESHAKQHQADEQQVKIRDGLLEAMLAKLAALLEADQQRLPASAAEAPRPAQDFGKFKEGLISCLQQLQQGRQLARGDQRQAESEARKKCARLEAQLRERTAALTKLEGKMHDLDLSLIEARQQTEKLQADNEELRGRRIRTSAVSRGLPSLATVSSATSAVPSTIHEGSEGGGESVAILRLRLEAMAKELKRMRELKAEEHSADKKRLAEQKRENRQLKNQMQLQLENGSMRTSSAMSGPIKYLEQ